MHRLLGAGGKSLRFRGKGLSLADWPVGTSDRGSNASGPYQVGRSFPITEKPDTIELASRVIENMGSLPTQLGNEFHQSKSEFVDRAIRDAGRNNGWWTIDPVRSDAGRFA